MSNSTIDEKYVQLEKDLIENLLSGGRLALVQAPPGSGKTRMLLAVVSAVVKTGKCVALAAQTNRQADDIAHRWARDYGTLPAIRLGSSNSVSPANFPKSVEWNTDANSLTRKPGIYISTAAKWVTMREPDQFDLLAIDEAWQMSWALLMQCAKLSENYLMIGDPGQIPPVVTIDVRRWETAPRPPHKPAPEVVLSDSDLSSAAFIGELPACRRLPFESVVYIKPFYDFDFVGYAQPGDRELKIAKPSAISPEIANLLGQINNGQPIIATIPTSADGPPIEVDVGLAKKVADIVDGLFKGKTKIRISGQDNLRNISMKDVGICATHRSMNGELRRALGAKYSEISIDTPERWQGLERPVMIVVHPLSSVLEPSGFDLETGRLCVMVSRHQVALIIVARDHIGATLNEFVPNAEQAPGQPDAVGRGHAAHAQFWNSLSADGRITALT